MERFFDFTNGNQRTLKIKVNEKKILLLLPPTLKLLEELEDYEAENAKVSDIKEFVLKILRNNKGKRQVDIQDINDYSMDQLKGFIDIYSEFVTEIVKDPN